MNWLIVLQVFAINLVYIMLNTIRTLLTMRGYRNVAPFIAIVEITIYTLGLSMVMNYLQENIFYLVFYALGFSIGIYLGMLVEDRIALGYSVLQVFTQGDNHALAQHLRQEGYGVTIQTGYGRDGDRLILTILTPRSREVELRNRILEISPQAFFIAHEAKYIQGGFWSRRMKRQEQAVHTHEPIQEEVSKEDFVDYETSKQ
ncbi:DUF2179 domain-containing protein [Hutsoniella sourekii]|uniref:DUF2179 domain-containing protein n=1 Tax=Hutsoniella sourekii TaxID=87650 RepID=UPI0004BCA3D5|nr:DUF2179 domain-containing protein [Hutsoniella sourekii]